MREKLLDLLVCPGCREPLECQPGTVAADGDIVTGDLRCRRCGRRYPIENGIPRFVPSENYAASFGYQWNKFRREQIDSLQGIQQSERRLRTETAWEPDWLRGKWILDAGCGAGRFLEVTSRTEGCEAVGVDISGAVDAVKETLNGRTNAHLVQASIFTLPFRPGAFDGVYCIGVIQHTPDPPAAVRALARVVRAGGRIALTMYERRRFTMLYSKYWVRPLTRRMGQAQLLTLIKVLMPPAFALSEVLFRLPVVGRAFRFAIPVANYVDDPELSWRQRYQWAILDTFDMLAPAFDTPQREGDVVGILTEEGVGGLKRLPNAGLNLIGTKG
jgi:SAM-dependent methyltransferase